MKTGTTGRKKELEKEEPKIDTPARPLNKTQESFKEKFSDKLATKVYIKKTGAGSGQIILNFNSEVDLNRIIEILNK